MGDFRCFECGQKDDYEMREVVRHYQGEGYEFGLNIKIPFCKKCGSQIANRDIENEITKLANDRIREMRGIIKTEEINEILSKYNVSQKFLSKILGWGEITLTRYVSGGYTPNKNNSDKLKSIKDPYVFKKILYDKIEETDGEITQEAAFHKLQCNINKQIEEIEIGKGKIFQIANWFLAQIEEDNYITHLALQKLLYFSQGWNYVFNQKNLFSDDCEAWVHGAVYRIIYDEFKKFKYNPLPRVDKKVNLLPEEEEVLCFVKNFYLNVYTAKTLEKICHLEEPYKLAREGYDNTDTCEEKIDKESIKTYYLKMAEKYNVSSRSQSNVNLYLNDLLKKSV